jgi:hypothetical protein
VRRAVLIRQFGVAEIEADTERFCGFEQRPRRRARHFAFEKAVEFGLIIHPPARKERGQRELGEDHDVAAARFGLAHQFKQPGHDLLARLVASDRAQLTAGDGEKAFHETTPGSAEVGSLCWQRV